MIELALGSGILASVPMAALSTTDVLAYAVAGLVLVVAASMAYYALRMSRPKREPRVQRRRQRSPSLSSAPSRSRGESYDGQQRNGGAYGPSAMLRERGAGREYALGIEPAILGASDSACTIVLEGEGVAPEHARIWPQGGGFMLHHVGGLSRKTYVGGQEVEWVILEAGDEVTIGSHKLVFEGLGTVPVAAVVAEEAPGKRETSATDDLDRMEEAVRELWAEASPASETAVGERSGLGKFKVHRRKDELAERVGAQWVKRGRTVVLER